MTGAPGRPRAAAMAIAALFVSAAACGGGESTRYSGPYARDVNATIPKIEQATGLRFKDPPKVETRSRAQVRAFLLDQLRAEDTRHEVVGQAAAYKRMGLLPDTMNYEAFLVDLLTEQVSGFYDPKTKVLYIPDDAKPEMVRGVLAHELVHALQDQYADLDSIQHARGNNDRSAAAQAVAEGQAMLVMLRVLGAPMLTWEQRRELIRESQSTMPQFAAAPLVVQETLLFPYINGADFVGRFYDRTPGTNPFDPDVIPVSTEQVLHDRAYHGTRDAPTRITLPPAASATVTYENTFGDFESRLILFQHTSDQSLAVRGAAGWDGDRYQILRTPRGDGIAWLTVWDTPVDAAEFADAMQRMITHRFDRGRTGTSPAGARLVHTQGRTLALWGGEVGDRAAVLYVDVPEGVAPDAIDVTKVRLEQ